MSLQKKLALKSVFRIREARELKALSDLGKIRHLQAQCETRVGEKKAELEHYYSWRKQYQGQMFAEQKGRVMSFNDLNEYQASLNTVLERESELLADVTQAKQQASEALQQLDEARARLIEVMKAKEKLGELVRVQQLELDRHQFQKEEQEVEEYTDRSHKPVTF